MMKTLQNNPVLAIVLTLTALVILTASFFSGCAKRLEGETYANEKPIVWFVNVPPEGAKSSVNPIVNWMGQDRDGQIDFYRYLVVREDEIGDSLSKPSGWNPSSEPLSEAEVRAFVDDMLLGMPDSLWTVLLVRADSTDPHSSNIIPMSAQMDDPVRTYVPQFVFVQAFDEEGLGSDVAFRRFLRNDNPPETRIVAFIPNVPFINSVLPSGPATGIRFRWQGSDAVDYPTDAPPFEFQWKLFGPYSDSLFLELIDSFETTVFVTNDARVFKFGLPPDTIGWDTIWIDSPTIFDTVPVLLPTSMIVCDTTYVGGDPVETCDTIHIDTLRGSNVYGVVDTLLRVYDDDFLNSVFDRVADSSHDEYGNVWVTDTRDSIYNAYGNAPSDTTQSGRFVFVIRSRDDAHVPDLTPAYESFVVIDPKHERDILVSNWSGSGHDNIAIQDSARNFWDRAIGAWINDPAGNDHTGVVFEPDIDYMSNMSTLPDTAFLKLLLKYKLSLVLQDAVQSGTWSNRSDRNKYANTLVGLQTGVNVWVMARVPLGRHLAYTESLRIHTALPPYQFFFGVQQTTFPGWGEGLRQGGDGYGYGRPRPEHFIGTLSLDPDQWPELAIDTALLRTRYEWNGSLEPLAPPFYPYLSELGALPQTGWCVRTFDTEVMYLFKSLYGQEHAIRSELSFHGRPVAIRLNRGLFRTVHFMFSPLAIEETAGFEMINGVLSWLYDGRVELTSAGKNTRHQSLASDLSSRYWQAYWDANGDRETFYELLLNAY